MKEITHLSVRTWTLVGCDAHVIVFHLPSGTEAAILTDLDADWRIVVVVTRQRTDTATQVLVSFWAALWDRSIG